MHALVVDGSSESAKQLTQHLHKLGLETAVAKTLAEARQLISQCRPDLIVSDRKLPDGSGLEFHDIAPGTRLVLSSANPDPNEFPPGTRILAKPFTARAVQEIVRISLNRMVSFPAA
jgi:CheY-like chemotaxis protein